MPAWPWGHEIEHQFVCPGNDQLQLLNVQLYLDYPSHLITQQARTKALSYQ
jgi:hypothetical protein